MREMKDSGIDWIGAIQGKWSVMRFKYVATVKSNLVDPSGFPELPQIAPDDIEKDSGKQIKKKTVQDSGVISWNHLFEPGQILYSKIRPTLNKATIASTAGLCSADMYPIEAVGDTRFTLYAMLSSYFVEQVGIVTRDRVKMPKINQEELGEIIVLRPPEREQKMIADYLDTRCAAIDDQIADLEAELTALEDYKKSLIFDYVTGKQEVPTDAC